MTLPSDHPAADVAAVPPPGCPAHDLVRLYGGEAEADPAGLYEKLREKHGPVAPVLLEGDVEAWLVLGYRENMEAARTPTRFTRDSRIWRDWLDGKIKPDSPLIPMVGWLPHCVSQDGEEHRRLRSALNDSLARFDKHGVRRHIQRYANQLIDGFAADGNAELLGQYAQHLPMLVLTRLFGMPEEVGPGLVEACTGLIRGGEKAIVHDQFIVEALTELTQQKGATPGHDFASWLISHPAGLTEDEVMTHLRLVLIAANETTTTLIANTLRMVLTDPRFRASLTGGLMTIPDAVEQVLWDEPPLMVCPGRFATGDMEFGGRQIKAGDFLVLGLAAGNADPAVRPDPAVAVHGNRSHLAFSRGPHECPGQDIGRAITDTAVDALLARLPDVRLAVPYEQLSWTSSTWARHLDALPAKFTPRGAAPTPAAGVSAGAGTGAGVRPSVGERVPSTTPTRRAATDEPQAQAARSTPAQSTAPGPSVPAASLPTARPSRWSTLIRRLLGR